MWHNPLCPSAYLMRFSNIGCKLTYMWHNPLCPWPGSATVWHRVLGLTSAPLCPGSNIWVPNLSLYMFLTASACRHLLVQSSAGMYCNIQSHQINQAPACIATYNLIRSIKRRHVLQHTISSDPPCVCLQQPHVWWIDTPRHDQVCIKPHELFY